jgi:CBS domain-containing protein
MDAITKFSVNQIMTYDVETISADATLQAAANKMKERNVGILPVVDDEAVVGVLTDRDVVVRAVSVGLRPEMTRVRQVMTRTPIVAYEDQDIAEVGVIMQKHLLHRLIVLNRRNQLVGLVSLSDFATKVKDERFAGHVLNKVAAA